MRKHAAIALLALGVAGVLAYPLRGFTQASVNILARGSQAIVNGSFLLPDGFLKVGRTGTPDAALARGGAWFSGKLEVDGAARFDGAVAFNGVTTFTDPIVFDANNVTVETITAPAALTVTAGTAGDGGLALPANSIGPTEATVFADKVILCGELAENGTTYLGPSTGAFGGNGADLSIGSTACDALDNATEATADAPILTLVPFKVSGLYCKTDGTLGASETLTFTLRTAAGATTPAITCALAVGQQECRSLTPTTTDIAAGATIAVKADEVSNNADDNAWCALGIEYK